MSHHVLFQNNARDYTAEEIEKAKQDSIQNDLRAAKMHHYNFEKDLTSAEYDLKSLKLCNHLSFFVLFSSNCFP